MHEEICAKINCSISAPDEAQNHNFTNHTFCKRQTVQFDQFVRPTTSGELQWWHVITVRLKTMQLTITAQEANTAKCWFGVCTSSNRHGRAEFCLNGLLYPQLLFLLDKQQQILWLQQGVGKVHQLQPGIQRSRPMWYLLCTSCSCSSVSSSSCNFLCLPCLFMQRMGFFALFTADQWHCQCSY